LSFCGSFSLSEHKSECRCKQEKHQEQYEAAETAGAAVETGTSVETGAEPHGTERTRMMHPSESGTESRSHVMTGRSETSSVRYRSETTAGISAAEMHIVSHHCSYLRSSFCGRTKKTSAALTAKVLLSHLGRTTVGMTVAKYASLR
jgi:hypothetical protein